MSARVHRALSSRAPVWPTRVMRFRAVCLVIAVALLAVSFTGCSNLRRWATQGFKVGPDYCRPPAPVADHWIDHENPDVSSDQVDYSSWWSHFGDPTLDQLVDSASQQNLTLQSAGMRILEARARLAIAQGRLFPQLQQSVAGFNRVNASATTANVFPIADFDNWNHGLTSIWELDFWGRYRRAIESEEALLNASIEDFDNVLVILQAEVAAAYVQLRTLQERLELAKLNVALQQRSADIASVRYRNKRTSELDVAQAKEILAATESLIPALESGIRQTGNAICVLLGVPPRDLTEELGDGAIPNASTEIVLGIPADLLRRRPDVRRAERFAAAQSALIGIAESDFYPRITITGSIGVEAQNFPDLFSAKSFTGAIGPGFRWNILNYGRILNNVRANEARFYELVIDYQNTVLEANREVEDGVISFLKERERVAKLDMSSQQAQRAVDIATTQYEKGLGNFLPVVYMQQELTIRQDQLAESRGQVCLNLIAVYKAIGGGWQTRMSGVNMPAETGILPMDILGEDEAPVPPEMQ